MEDSPVLMAWAIFLIAISPEEHSLLTVDMGTSWGMPADRAAALDEYKGDGGWQVPVATEQGSPSQRVQQRHDSPYLTYAYIINFYGIKLSLL